MAYFWKMKVVLKPGSRFGHKTRGADTAVTQATSIREMSLEFLPLSPVEVQEKKWKTCNRIYYLLGFFLDAS